MNGDMDPQQDDPVAVRHAERLARARSGPEQLRGALFEEMDEGDDARLGPFFEEAGLIPPTPNDLEAKIFEATDARWAELEREGSLWARFVDWWSHTNRALTMSGAGLAAAAVVTLIVVLPPSAPTPGDLYGAARTDSDKIVSAWLLDTTAARPPPERGALLLAAADRFARSVPRGPDAGPSPLERTLKSASEAAERDTWAKDAKAVLAAADLPERLEPESSRIIVYVLEDLLNSAAPTDRPVLEPRAESLYPVLEGAPRARFALRVGQYLARIGDRATARTWLVRARDGASAGSDIHKAAVEALAAP